jgi:hypothetical protein
MRVANIPVRVAFTDILFVVAAVVAAGAFLLGLKPVAVAALLVDVAVVALAVIRVARKPHRPTRRS